MPASSKGGDSGEVCADDKPASDSSDDNGPNQYDPMGVNVQPNEYELSEDEYKDGKYQDGWEDTRFQPVVNSAPSGGVDLSNVQVLHPSSAEPLEVLEYAPCGGVKRRRVDPES
jgi:hypothetical protein